MASRKARDIAGALLRKGFRRDDNHHKYYFLYVGDRKTSVRTKLSHGSEGSVEYGDKLLSQIQKQLRFGTDKKRFYGLLDCPMSGEEYLEYLRQNNHVRVSNGA